MPPSAADKTEPAEAVLSAIKGCATKAEEMAGRGGAHTLAESYAKAAKDLAEAYSLIHK